jgi:hypothetical protein
MTNTCRWATLARELLVGTVGVENHQSYRELTLFPGITTPTTVIQFSDAL